MKKKAFKLLKNNNKGYSLIELIVTIAILGIISTSIFVFFVTGANTYDRIDDTLNLQEQAQFTLANIQEKALDCNGSVSWNDTSKTLTLTNVDDSGNTIATHVYNAPSARMLYNGDPLGTYMSTVDTPFEVVINEDDDGIPTSIDVTLRLHSGGTGANALKFETTRTIAFRNTLSAMPGSDDSGDASEDP